MAEKVGIIGWGSYIPKNRLSLFELAAYHEKNFSDLEKLEKGLMVEERAIPEPYEDTVTMMIEASCNALQRAGIGPEKLGAVYVGTETGEDEVKPTAIQVADFIGVRSRNVHICDLKFACISAMEGIDIVKDRIVAGSIEYGLVGATDISDYEGDAKFTAGAGAAAFIIGRGDSVVAAVKDVCSYAVNTNDFWRRTGQRYPKTTQKSKAAYTSAVTEVYSELKKRNPGVHPAFYVMHTPYPALPIKTARQFGLSEEEIDEKVKPIAMVGGKTGNQYAASVFNALIYTLEEMTEESRLLPGDAIFMIGYGSGQKSMGMVLEVQEGIKEKVGLARKLMDQIQSGRRVPVSYYYSWREGSVKGCNAVGRIRSLCEDGLRLNICNKCGRIHSVHAKMCSADECNGTLEERFYPSKACLLSFRGLEENEDILKVMKEEKEVVRILYTLENLKKESNKRSLKMKIVKLKEEGPDGIINYGPAYL